VAGTALIGAGVVCGVVLRVRTWENNQRRCFTRQAVDSLAIGTADPAVVVIEYLRTTYGALAVEPSATEIDFLMKRRGVPSELRQCCASWFRRARAQRFGPPTAVTADPVLAAEAIELIELLEESQ